MRKAISAVLVALWICSLPVFATDDRPANFVFLLDVSGSMLYPSEMVKASDGTKITLFESLRQALKQIAQDPRVIGTNSKACVITFGSKITEKTDWPQQIISDEQRQKLVGLIGSPEALQADKHGDTYMGGAIAAALERANSFYAASDPCTTTFVVMLTDGWDEPPAGASVKVRDAAARYVARSRDIQGKLGAKTWQALVIGLQNLPERKSGTITAKELAGLMDGQFIDVTKEAGGTVSEKIFLSLKHTVESLKGELTVAANDGSGSVKGGILQFGTVDGNGSSTVSFPIESRSCYAEQINAAKDVTASLDPKEKNRLCSGAGSTMGCKLVSELPAGAITVKLSQETYNISPQLDEKGRRKSVSEPISIVAQVHSNCPAGHFAGALALDASAKVPGSIPYVISVPGRLVSDQENLQLLVKKPGLFWTESASGTLEDSLKESAGAHSHSMYTITLIAGSAQLGGTQKSHSDGPPPTIDAKQINDGKPLTVSFDTSKGPQQLVRMDVFIPANQVPGKYKGKISVNVTGATDIVAPSEIPFEILVEPSPWEKVAPIAVPLFLLLGFTLLFWVFFWLRTLRR